VLERTDAAAPAIRANGTEIAVAHSGCHPLVEDSRQTTAELELRIGDGVACHGVQLTPGVAE
jgi:hypothetical protein